MGMLFGTGCVEMGMFFGTGCVEMGSFFCKILMRKLVETFSKFVDLGPIWVVVLTTQ